MTIKYFNTYFCTKKIELLFKKKKNIHNNYLEFTEMCLEFGKTMVFTL